LKAHSQAKIPDFRPPGLQEYLESRDEAGTKDAATKVIRIHKRLSDDEGATPQALTGVA
jgi:hypothetical protein